MIIEYIHIGHDPDWKEVDSKHSFEKICEIVSSQGLDIKFHFEGIVYHEITKEFETAVGKRLMWEKLND